MNIRIRCMLPVLLLLGGCATMDGNSYSASAAPPPTAAPPQRVDAVSSAIGARMDDMLASQHASGNSIVR